MSFRENALIGRRIRNFHSCCQTSLFDRRGTHDDHFGFKLGRFRLKSSSARHHLHLEALKNTHEPFPEPTHGAPSLLGKKAKTIVGGVRRGSFLEWLLRKPMSRFGRYQFIPNYFQRNDEMYLALDTRKPTWSAPPPVYHDLLDAVARVGFVESCIGYNFANKIIAVEALKLTRASSPLYYNGVINPVGRNDRLALMGDRVLNLALCEIWFQTENTKYSYQSGLTVTVSRAALDAKGRELGIDKTLLLPPNRLAGASLNDVAESLEAILGAVYLDSGHNMQALKNVLTTVGLDNHESVGLRWGPKVEPQGYPGASNLKTSSTPDMGAKLANRDLPKAGVVPKLQTSRKETVTPTIPQDDPQDDGNKFETRRLPEKIPELSSDIIHKGSSHRTLSTRISKQGLKPPGFSSLYLKSYAPAYWEWALEATDTLDPASRLVQTRTLYLIRLRTTRVKLLASIVKLEGEISIQERLREQGMIQPRSREKSEDPEKVVMKAKKTT